MKVGILSDTHGHLHPRIPVFFRDVDEIWHAGDIGSLSVVHALQALKPLRAVYGNIDGRELRLAFREHLVFRAGEIAVVMTHIAGYPGRYTPAACELIAREKPGLFVCGHSHILKVMYDDRNRLLHINPGAAGNYGLHRSVTAVRLEIDGSEMKNLEVLDLPRSVTDQLTS